MGIRRTHSRLKPPGPHGGFYRRRSKSTVKVTHWKFMVQLERPCHKEHLCQILKPYLLGQSSYDQCLSFLKVGQRSCSRSHVQILRYCRKGLVIKNTNMNALSLRIKKLLPLLKFFKSRSKVTVKVTYSKSMLPSERHSYNEQICQIWKSCL